MKKVLLVLTLVVAYGIAIANVSGKVVTAEKATITIAADSDNFSVVVEEEKDKKKDKKTATKAVGEKPSTGCSDAQKKSCAASGKTCGDAKETTEKKATKSCCGSKK